MNTKRTLACAALLLGLLSFNAPLTAAVESDIVGYTTPQINADTFTLLGVPFVTLAEEGEAIAVNDLVKGDFAAGDTIQFSNGSGYSTLTYRTSSTLNGVAMGPAWCEGRSTYSTKTFQAGEAFWLKSQASATFVGRVGENTPIAVNAQEMKMIANPIPKDVAINEITFTGVSTGDTVQFYDATGYVTLTYRASSTDSTGTQKGPAWCEGRSTYSTRIVPAGTGFWVKAANDISVSF